MDDESVQLRRCYKKTYISPKTVGLDRIFKENLLSRTNLNTSSHLSCSNTETPLSCSESLTKSGLKKSVLSKTYSVLKSTSKKCGAQRKGIDSATVDTLIDILVSKILSNAAQDADEDSVDEFCCPRCRELLYQPMTLICGHTLCKTCFHQSSHCVLCKSKLGDKTSANANVVLTSILQKWHPTEYVGRSLTEEGDELMKKNDIQEAISKYMDAIECVPNSHVASCNRARAFAALGNLEGALEDAIRTESLARWWPEAQFIKGEVLAAMRNDDEALTSYLTCLSLDPTYYSAKVKAREIVERAVVEGVEEDCLDFPVSRKRKRVSETDYDRNGDAFASSLDNTFSFTGSKNEHSVVFTRSSMQNDCSSHGEDASEDILSTILAELDSSSVSDSTSGDGQNEDDTPKESTVVRLRRTVDESLVESTDFECSLCMRTYYLPVCTFCGHTFCRECIERCIDHSMPCPLCKRTINKNIIDQKLCHPSVDVTTQAIIQRFLPDQHNERLQQEEEEIKQLKQSVPIFVCTIGFPSVSCPLHIYEPRYRLMLRRVLDVHGKEFGICRPLPNNTFSGIGTLLNVRNVTFFPDGRSVVESVGSKRFEVLEFSSKDGYDTAKVRYIVDEPVEREEDIAVLKKLVNVVYQQASDWFDDVDHRRQAQIKIHFGEFPDNDDSQGENGPRWTWWTLAVLPVDDKVKMGILGKKLLRDRLLLLHRILTYLKKRRQQVPANAPALT